MVVGMSEVKEWVERFRVVDASVKCVCAFGVKSICRFNCFIDFHDDMGFINVGCSASQERGALLFLNQAYNKKTKSGQKEETLGPTYNDPSFELSHKPIFSNVNRVPEYSWQHQA
ncbi:hypothetical protein VNO77_15827 [Canavalia gladiata]|uniref:Uncharacterized protein n=1 Tax=Canavalia gladiata TaxID=3824 RepID=A0AAN9M323_CANGL